MLTLYIALYFFLVISMTTAVIDLTTMRIPNALNLALLVAFLIFAVAAQLQPMGILWALAAGAIGFAAAYCLFEMGVMGGGDVKFIAAALPWFGWTDTAVQFLIWTAIYGGVLSAGLILFRSFPLPALLFRQEWIVRLHQPRGDAPYGVALSVAAIQMSPQILAF